MTRTRSRSPLTVAAIGLAVCLGPVVAASVLADLGVTEDGARSTVYNWFCGGGIYFPGDAKVFKDAPDAVRAEMVKAVLAFGKAYLQSDAFASRYAEYRDANRPPTAEPGELEGGTDSPLGQMEANIKAMQEAMKTLPPDMQKEMRKAIEDLRAEMKEMMSDPETRKAMEQGVRAQQEEVERNLQKAQREFEERYPADVNQMVAHRLREFLALTSDIDFGATLVSEGGTKRFADPKLEEKSREWKYCFRAGRPAVNAARAFAQAWLSEVAPD